MVSPQNRLLGLGDFDVADYKYPSHLEFKKCRR
jgi:hypothetical protein